MQKKNSHEKSTVSFFPQTGVIIIIYNENVKSTSNYFCVCFFFFFFLSDSLQLFETQTFYTSDTSIKFYLWRYKIKGMPRSLSLVGIITMLQRAFRNTLTIHRSYYVCYTVPTQNLYNQVFFKRFLVWHVNYVEHQYNKKEFIPRSFEMGWIYTWFSNE